MKYGFLLILGAILVPVGFVAFLLGLVVPAIIVIAIGVTLLAVSFKPCVEQSKRVERERLENMAPDQKEKFEKKRKAKTIRQAYILGIGTKTSAGSALGRAAVGDFIAGDVGAIIGAATAKEHGVTKFLVEYEDNHTAIEIVKDNSERFKTLIKYVNLQSRQTI